jgi:hypothetical protein
MTSLRLSKSASGLRGMTIESGRADVRLPCRAHAILPGQSDARVRAPPRPGAFTDMSRT